jgi:anti-anti-sigma regulatory factor
VCGQSLWFVERPMNDTCVVVAPVTELINEGDTVKQVGEVLAAAGNRRRLVVDLSRLRFLPNSVIKVLLALQRRLRALGGSLTICGLHPANYHALRRARLTTVLNICDDPEMLFDC